MDGINWSSLSENAIIILGAAGLWYQQRKHGKKNSEKLDTVKDTLTSTNGGSHVKDDLNMINSKLDDIQAQFNNTDRRLTSIENFQNSLSSRVTGLDARLTAHVATTLVSLQTLLEEKVTRDDDKSGSGS